MKRDLDLVRSILLWMEAQPEGRNINWKLSIGKYTDEEVAYHCHLMAQAGLILAHNSTFVESHSPQATPGSITWAGYEFLDLAKHDKLWAKAKRKILAPAGGIAFSLLLEWLKAEASTRLGISKTPSAP